MDVILAAGIPVAPPQVATAANGYQAPAFDLHRYADRAQRRPLIALGASKDLEGAVDAAVDRAILQAPGKLAELPGLHPALRRWLERQTASAVEGTLASLDQAVIVLEKGASPSVLALAPDIAKRLGDIDVAHVLWQTLRGGLVAELAWPGLEANRDLDLGHVTLAGTAWPALLVSDGKKAAAIDATGTRLVHDLRYPPNQASWARAPLVLANGQLFVGWRFPKTEGYWSGRPNDVFEPDGSLIEAARPMGGAETSLELPDGSRFQGGAPIRAGDRRAAAARPVVSDGETVWVLTESGTLREAELETGKTGRVSRPSFFEDFAAEGWELDLELVLADAGAARHGRRPAGLARRPHRPSGPVAGRRWADGVGRRGHRRAAMARHVRGGRRGADARRASSGGAGADAGRSRATAADPRRLRQPVAAVGCAGPIRAGRDGARVAPRRPDRVPASEYPVARQAAPRWDAVRPAADLLVAARAAPAGGVVGPAVARCSGSEAPPRCRARGSPDATPARRPPPDAAGEKALAAVLPAVRSPACVRRCSAR